MNSKRMFHVFFGGTSVSIVADDAQDAITKACALAKSGRLTDLFINRGDDVNSVSRVEFVGWVWTP